jgi:hypothetical protein
MMIIIKRASFSAEDFNAETTCSEFGLARNFGSFIAIEISDHAIDAFKETLRNAYASLDADYETWLFQQDKLEQVVRKQIMIRQIITKIFKPD